MKRSNSNSNGVVNLSLASYSQLESSRNVDAVLYFIIPKGLTETTCTSLLRSAKKLCDDSSLHSQWIQEIGVKKMKPKRNNIFILDPFSGPAYEFLENLGQNSKEIIVIGPQCIHYALNRQDIYSAIESRGFPFYTMGMRNICITFTGFKPDDQKELTNLVQKMNGIVSKPFCTAITHVVAHHVLTPKCKEAFKNEVPVMSANWIHQVWQDSQKEYIDATDSKYIVHTCGIFHNVNICVSQVPSTLKNTIEKIIIAGGGFYTKDFRRNVTQVLVVPTASGEKYKFADQWNVPTVTPDWVHKSKEAGHVVSFEDFKPPRRPIYNSTQISEDVEPQIPDFSNITAASIIDEVHVVNASEFNNCTVLTAQASDIRKTDLDSLRLIAGGVLDGCKLYLCHCDSPRMAELRLILIERGIVCCSEYSDTVTHVVVINGSISEKEIRAVKLSKNRIHIVSFDWLVQCALKGQHLDEASYESEVQEIIQSCETRSKESLRQELNKSLGLLEMNQRTSGGAHANSTTGRNSGDKLQRNPSQSAFVQPECVQRVKSVSAKKEQEDSLSIKDGDPSFTVAEEAFVFSGFKFAVMLESQEESSRVMDLIKESSGEILQNKDLSTPDDFILVVPPVYKLTEFTPWKSFTKYWVTEVIEEKTLEIPENFYHLPLEANESLKNLMNGVVLAISAYPAHIKEYITKVAIHLGAKVQEVFSRKDTKGSFKSTHLICGVTDNDKYRAAQRWGTPAVSLDWILKCYEKQILLDHTDFLLQTDTSDMTVFMYMKTPNNAEKNQLAVEKPATSVKNNPNGNSVIPGTDKSKVDGFRRPQTRTIGKLNFDRDNSVEAPKLQAPSIHNPFIKNPVPSETVESPIIPGMTRSGSRQLKRAIDWAIMDSPVTNKKERRKSTPISEIMRDVNDLLAKRTEELRRKYNVSPVNGWICDVDKEKKENHSDTPEKPNSPHGKIASINLYQDFVNVENEDGEQASTSKNIRRKGNGSTLLRELTRQKGQQPENKFDYMDDFVAGIHDDGEASEIQWEADVSANNKEVDEDPVEVEKAKIPEVVQVPEKAVKHDSPLEVDLVSLESNKNVKKKRGTGSSVHSHKSSASSTASSSGKCTRSKRNQEPEVVKTLCFATSGGSAAEKERYQSIIIQLGGTTSSIEHYDAKTDAVIATKVARSEKILGSIAAGKPVLHPSYINACEDAGRLVEFEDYIWDENHCKSNSEMIMARVAQYWYKMLHKNAGAGPYSKFVAKVCEDKVAAKKNAYIRLIEAGGGRIAGDNDVPNIIISDGRSISKSDFPPNVPVKVPVFLNDVIINFDDKNLQTIA